MPEIYFFVTAGILFLCVFIVCITFAILFYKERERKKEAIDILHEVRSDLSQEKFKSEFYQIKEIREIKKRIKKIEQKRKVA